MFIKPTLHGWTQEKPGVLKPTPTRADARVKELSEENQALKTALAMITERIEKLEDGNG
jgi:hypothetical protein